MLVAGTYVYLTSYIFADIHIHKDLAALPRFIHDLIIFEILVQDFINFKNATEKLYVALVQLIDSL